MGDYKFTDRHIGPDQKEKKVMLAKAGAPTMDKLIDEVVPKNIHLNKPLNLPDALTERDYNQHIKGLGTKNTINRNYIGKGYYNCIVPPVIQRNVLENPGWYTAYTPYQSEIAQGRLEALVNFQTMVSDLTGMELANASLLDEATAAAEAMVMIYNIASRDPLKKECKKFFVSEECFHQTIEVLKTRAEPLKIDLVIGSHESELDSDVFGALIQYPSGEGAVYNYSEFAKKTNKKHIKLAVAADLLSLCLLIPPGEWGADVVIGSTQRFGVPLGYGGPHAAYFATKEDFKRYVPGRIIGASRDAQGNLAYRMALQTREQHIRRDKATSNICTSQVLLAVMAGMYAVYNGKDGLKAKAEKVHFLTALLNDNLQANGHTQHNKHFFDTLSITPGNGISAKTIKERALEKGINFWYDTDSRIGISVDETTKLNDIKDILAVFGQSVAPKEANISLGIPKNLGRTSSYLTHPVFNTHHSETEMMRYIKSLENKDLSLTHSMIPLGSCTMKLNAASELFPISWESFANLHPYAPLDQANGYMEVINSLEKMLCSITGFAGISFQPNSGAQGEYAGLMVIKEYHRKNKEGHRNVVLIPSSAHGTNPASAVMAGLKVVVVKCDESGNIDLVDLNQKAVEHKELLAGFMVTYPSTHGVYEENIMEINEIIHQNGGLVYMDGANLNAQIGITNPAFVGADVCHLNLHKTFAIPHGGGGPGMGPIGVVEKLLPYLPKHSIIKTGGKNGITSISQAPWGSALILLISYGYIRMLGSDGLTEASKTAILNANYIKECLKDYCPVLYLGANRRVAHELILDCRKYKKTANIEVEDIAKRLIDYGFHAPTVSFPVPGTLMIEPTESETKDELDRFCEAMIKIIEEIKEIEQGLADPSDNVLKNAPHSIHVVTADIWNHPYSREKAAYPLSWVKDKKFWPVVGRVDNAYGDRNLICSCPPLEEQVSSIIDDPVS